jgi:ribokinase
MRITSSDRSTWTWSPRRRSLPRAGETVTGATLARHPGGKGANQALAAQRLGAEVFMIGRVGRRRHGGRGLALLLADGVDTGGVRRRYRRGPTGVALIAVDAGRREPDRGRGGGQSFGSRPEQLPARIECPLIVQLELPIETVEAAVGRATEFVCVNLAPAAPVSDQLLRRADLIVVNETEAAFYGDLLHHGGGRVVVTRGAAGAVMYQRGVEVARATPPKVRPWTRPAPGTPSWGRSAWPCWKGWSRTEALTVRLRRRGHGGDPGGRPAVAADAGRGRGAALAARRRIRRDGPTDSGTSWRGSEAGSARQPTLHYELEIRPEASPL